MAGRGHHTLPRFLQKGFASFRKRKTVKTWVYRKDGTHVETNIVNVGKEHDFYGKDGEPNADATITKFENVYAPLLDALRNEPDGALAGRSQVPELVAHLARRSSSLRASLVGVTQTVLKGVIPKAEVEIKKRIKVEIKKGRQKLLREARRKLKAEGRNPRLAPLIVAHLEPELALLESKARSEAIDPMLQVAHDAIEQTVPKTFRESHNAALATPDSMDKLRELYGSRFAWSVRVSEVPLILGDTACVFEVAGERRYVAVDDGARKVFLPISHDRALVGLAESEQIDKLDGTALNEIAASCSSKFFISSKELPKDSPLPGLIGTKAGILTDDEVEQVVSDVRSDG